MILINKKERVSVKEMANIHSRFHITDPDGNDRVFYFESSGDDVLLEKDNGEQETLTEFTKSLGALSKKDNVQPSDIPVDAKSNIYIPPSVLNLNDLIKSLGNNAFSSGTTASRATGDEDGVNIKQNYLKKTEASETYVQKVDTSNWILDGRVHSTPNDGKLYLVGSSSNNDNVEVAKKSSTIYVEGNTLYAPVVNGLASSAKEASNATNAINDGNGNPISTTYLKNETFSKEIQNYVTVLSTSTWKVTDENVTTENTVAKAYITGSQDIDSSTGKLTKNPHIYAQGSTLTAPYFDGTASKAISDKNGNDITETYFKIHGGEIDTNPTIKNDISETSPDNALITKKYLKDSINDIIIGDIGEFVNAMRFKGTIGDENSDFHEVPSVDVKYGDMYKILKDSITITSENSSNGNEFIAKNGDAIIATDPLPKWTLIPSGDEPILYLRYSTTTSNLTDTFSTGEITLGEAAIKQIATVIGETGNLITDTAVNNALKNYATKKDLEDVSMTDNKVETSPTTSRFFLVGSTRSDTTTSKLSKSAVAYIEDGSLTIPRIISNLDGTASYATIASRSSKAESDINGNRIDETYTSITKLGETLLDYVSKESTASWAVTDRNVASVAGNVKMYLVGSDNPQTNTNILQKNQNLYFDNGTLYSLRFNGSLEGKASSAAKSDESVKATQDRNGNVIDEYYIAKKDTASWDVSPNEDTHVTNTVSVEKMYLTGSPSSVSATETQIKNQNIFAHGSTLTAPLVDADIKLNNVSNPNFESTKLSEVLNSLGSMAFRNSEGSLDPNIVYVFDGRSPADLVE